MSRMTVSQALEIVRTTHSEDVHPSVRNITDSAVRDIWQKIQADPHGYVMTPEELAVFNFYFAMDPFSYREGNLGQIAIDRYWRHHRYGGSR